MEEEQKEEEADESGAVEKDEEDVQCTVPQKDEKDVQCTVLLQPGHQVRGGLIERSFEAHRA